MAAAAAIFFAPAAHAEPAQSGVLVYDAQFFADARPNTAFDMIKRLPGFTFDAGAPARGFAGTAGNVLVDGGRPTSKTDSLDSILVRIPASDVERIELVRGGAPGLDMQGQTVVANVIRKKADSTRVVATAENVIFLDGRMVPYAALEFTRHMDGRTYEGSASLVNNWDDSVGTGRHDIFTAGGILLTRDVARSHGMGIGGALKGAATLPLWGGEFKTNLTLQSSPFISRLTYDRLGSHQLFIDKSRDNSGELGLHWRGDLGGVELEALLLQRLGRSKATDSANDTVNLEEFGAKNETGETIARTTLRYRPLDSLTLEWGAEAAYNFLDGQTSFSVNGAPIALPSANVRVEEKRGEAFLQGTWKFAADWLFEAGARFEYSTISETGDTSRSRSFFYPKPRAVLSWSVDGDTQVRVRYEKVLGQLDFSNFVASSDLASTGVTAGNADLRPDQRTQFEISFERHFWEKGAFVLSLMHEEVTDVVDVVAVTGTSGTFAAPGNIGSGTDDQLSVSLTLPLDRLGVSGGLLRATNVWNFTKVRDPIAGFDRVITRQRPQNINLKFTQDIESLKSTWGAFYYNGWDEFYYRLTEVRHRAVIPPYVGVFWEWKPTPAWSVHIEADNIVPYVYNDRREEYSGPRNAVPLSQIEVYNTHSQPTFDIQVRRTF